MRKSSARHIILILWGVVLLFSACKRNQDAASEKIKERKHSKEAVTITESESFDIGKIDTAYYYYGLLEDSCFYFKVNAADQQTISGHYYPVDGSVWLEAVPFTISYRDKKYYFKANGEEKSIRFSVTIDTSSFFGEFSTDPAGLLTRSFFFERYYEPKYQDFATKRFKESIFQAQVKPDVVYGTAKGYWCSYPMNDTKYLKMLTSTLGKTASRRNLDLTMDVYMPEDDTLDRHPLIVFLHGGAFYFGDKGATTMSEWCKHFAETGYVTASINYRLGFQISRASIQRCGYMAIQDAHAALRYLVANAKEYGIDTNAIFVAGTSAGAITALNVALTTNATCPAFVQEHNLTQKCGRLEDSGNSLKNKFKVKAIANMWGALYDLDVLKNKRIPIISFHGTEDHIVPYDEGYPFSSLKSNIGERLFDKMYGSKAIHERMNELHIHNQFFPIEGMGHSPYEDADGHLNHNYYFIQNKIQNFFLDILCGNCSVGYDKKNPTRFTLSNSNIAQTSWKVEGGFITESTPGEIQVLWRKNAPKHTVTASCLLKNGASSTKKITLKRSK
ncbi:MAG: alpha/beta hydrolase [Bacteroidales bacterium]|nr:alpha/beta hydrolase [Bacteroidales bacterium]